MSGGALSRRCHHAAPPRPRLPARRPVHSALTLARKGTASQVCGHGGHSGHLLPALLLLEEHEAERTVRECPGDRGPPWLCPAWRRVRRTSRSCAVGSAAGAAVRLPAPAARPCSALQRGCHPLQPEWGVLPAQLEGRREREGGRERAGEGHAEPEGKGGSAEHQRRQGKRAGEAQRRPRAHRGPPPAPLRGRSLQRAACSWRARQTTTHARCVAPAACAPPLCCPAPGGGVGGKGRQRHRAARLPRGPALLLRAAAEGRCGTRARGPRARWPT